MKQYQRLFDMDGVKCTFTSAALTAVAKRAIERESGAVGCAPSSRSRCWRSCTRSPPRRGQGSRDQRRGRDHQERHPADCLRGNKLA
ncbi:MAG: hypothetical protein R3B07_34235 [Polyangiaceae bacterium]